MTDFILVLAIVVLFWLGALYVRACDKL